MSLLEQILRDMWIDPDVLAELTKDQKEILFHKMREEQVRRWQAWFNANASDKPRTKKLKFAEYAVLFDDSGEDKRADEAAKRLAQAEAKREQEEMASDEQQSRILAEIEAQEEVNRRLAEAERHAQELRRREEEEKKRLAEQAEQERMAALEREQYMTMKEARLAAEKEAKARAEREAAAQRLAEEREKEEKRILQERARAEEEAKRQAETKQKELYQSMRELREQQRRAKEEEERRMDALFAEQELQAKKADAEKRAAAERARRQSNQEAMLAKTADILGRLQAERGVTAAAHQLKSSTISNKRPAPPPPGPPGAGAGSSATLPAKSSGALRGSAAGNPEARPSRPPNEAAVVEWFKTDEMSKNSGRDPTTGQWFPWFHGMISRQDAETLLKGQPMGSFLIRISSRIWGYTLSFVDSDRFKHFLVDATDGQYSVFGAQTSRTHSDLSTLVRFHQSIAVSKTGTRLTNPVGAKTGNRSIIKLVGN